jgi:hypothetical protein
MKMIIIGNIGSDAGYWVLDATGLHHVGGWASERLLEFGAALKIIGAATQLKTPGVAEAAIKSVHGIAQSALADHFKAGGEGTVVVMT